MENEVMFDTAGSGCWLWTGNISDNGYGPHRRSYEESVGPIPPGLQLDHLCRIRSCVNPQHLEPVTCRENLLRGNTFNAKNAAKTHCSEGHELAGENLRKNQLRLGKRGCRTCYNTWQNARRISHGRTDR